MEDIKQKPQAYVICHCGNCQVKCNKHGKRAKCADCKKRRMLGTVVEKGVMRHVCDECCDAHQKKLNEERERHISAALIQPNKGNT
jgi:hypothetical protein